MSDPRYTEIETQHGTYKVRADVFEAAFDDYRKTVEADGVSIEEMPPLEIAMTFFLCGCQCGDTLKWDRIIPGCADTLIKLVRKGEKEPEAG